MTRIVTIAAAQLGPIQRDEPRSSAVARMMALMREAKAHGCQLVVFPECALTAFFPHWWFDRQDDIDAFFERAMPNEATQPLFDLARELAIGFHLGYAELAIEDGKPRHYNTAILVDATGRIIGKYRKVHLPGHADHRPAYPYQNLEKRYFDIGNLGFPVFRAFGGVTGMMVCNDRRWPESYRVMGLQGVELIVLGYNTPAHNPSAPEHDPLGPFHNQLVMQAGAYQNATWVVGVAKAGDEGGIRQIASSMIIAPSGEIVAACTTERDELAIARCDLDLCKSYKTTTFNFAAHRRTEAYGLIVERTGAVPPE